MPNPVSPLPTSVIVANNMIMEAETAHVLQTCQMLAAFARIGCHVTYLWPGYGRTVDVLADLPIDHRPIHCRARYGKARYAEFTARLMPELHRLIGSDSGNRDAVVMSRSLGVALAGQWLTPRLVLELHQDLSPVARRMVSLLGRRIRWVAISGTLRTHLVQSYRLPSERVVTCHDAVDFSRFAQAEPLPMTERPWPAGLGPEAPVHLYYGTLRPERGLDLIAKAARDLPDHGFVLIGGTPAEVEAARTCGLDQPNVTVQPAVIHALIPRLLRSYRSVLLPYTRRVATHRWMSPLKLFEVLASGTPAVVSRLGPITEVVDDDQAAFIDLDDPESLTTQLRALEQNPEAALCRAGRGQRVVGERYTWDQRARDILALAKGH